MTTPPTQFDPLIDEAFNVALDNEEFKIRPPTRTPLLTLFPYKFEFVMELVLI